MEYLKILAITALTALTLAALPVRAQTVGAHLVSLHIPTNLGRNNVNTGLYYRADNGLTVGLFRNSINRTSLYGAYQFAVGPVDIAIGLMNGYKKECVRVSPTSRNCTGYSTHQWIPLLVPSYAFQPIVGFVPRLALVAGRQSVALNLSIEKHLR